MDDRTFDNEAADQGATPDAATAATDATAGPTPDAADDLPPAVLPPAAPPESAAEVMAEIDRAAEATALDDFIAGIAPTEDDVPAGLAVLEELSGGGEGEESAIGSYGYDRKIANEGKWFKWRKLGPAARVFLRKVGCDAWNGVIDRARERYGDESGNIPPKTMKKIIEPLMVKSLFGGMEGVVVRVGDPALRDTPENRLRLLEMFTPDLANDLFATCKNPRNFRDLSEEVLGN